MNYPRQRKHAFCGGDFFVYCIAMWVLFLLFSMKIHAIPGIKVAKNKHVGYTSHKTC